jgi:hypothetical protein
MSEISECSDNSEGHALSWPVPAPALVESQGLFPNEPLSDSWLGSCDITGSRNVMSFLQTVLFDAFEQETEVL